MSVSEIDIWRAAKLLMDRYEDQAPMEAAQRSNAALESGDTFNYELWQRVTNALNELQWPGRPDGKPN